MKMNITSSKNHDMGIAIEILNDLDLDGLRKFLGRPQLGKRLGLAILHKARYEQKSISDEKRQASRKWLEDNGIKRLYSVGFPADGSLPL